MKKLGELFEKYRKALVTLLVIIITLVAWRNTSKPKGTKLPKYSTKTREETSENIETETIQLVKAEPPSGDTNPKNTDMIELTFNEAVDISELQIKTRPQISLRAKKLAPQTILIYPDSQIWQKNTYYHLTLLGLRDEKTKNPVRPVEYVYYYTEFPATEAGEGWMLNATPEELEEYGKGYIKQ